MEYNNPSFKECKNGEGIKFVDVALSKDSASMSRTAAANEGSAIHASATSAGSGVFLNRRRLLWIIAGVVLVVVLVIGLAVGVNHHVTRDPQGGASLSQSTNQPWNSIDLPESLSPSNYSIVLSIDPDNPRFTGSCEVTFQCLERTKYLVLHVGNGLTIYKDQVSIWKKGHPHQRFMKIAQQFAQDKFHYHVIEIGGGSSSLLESGGVYVVSFGKFSGDISSTTTNGLFMSSYSNEKGDASR